MNQVYRKERAGERRWQVRLGLLGLGLALHSWVGGRPAIAAERVIISYGAIERSIQVSQLERFADTGELDPQLAAYVRLFNLEPGQLAQLRQALNASAEFDVVAVGQFLYTPQGKFLLKQVSRVIQTPSRQAGFLATRGALILAAADPNGGLTLLNVLRHFPSEGLRIDVARGLAVVDLLNQTLGESSQAIQAIQVQSAAAAAQLSPEGQLAIAQALAQLETERLYSARVFDLNVPGLQEPADLYLPEPLPGTGASPFNRPVVVISHGLGSDRGSFAYLAENLTEFGVAVVAVEHPGSNARQLSALLEGQTNFVTPTEEFIDRPQQVTLTLDALERQVRINPAFRNRMNLDRVGIIGQSFGGYTALALAGATIDSVNLGSQCSPTTLNLNLSLLLQCQATLLINPGRSLVDPRIQAVFVMNPVGSALFGQSGYAQVKVPVMVVAGSADTVAPAFPEQIEPFDWITSPERYLALIGNGSHFSVIGDEIGPNQPIPVPPEIIGPRPDIAQGYMELLSLIFFKAHLEEQLQYRALLQPAFIENFVSADPLPLSLIEAQPLLTEPLATPAAVR
ncbi:MAG: alpha/beta hydrolase [Cyanobacteria bacterium Co-bin13]|nr:alpha/beta hydrolase [Cyanobacteria bacterium Co-bin13]